MQSSRKYPAGDHQIQESRLLEYLQRRLKQLGLKGMIHTFRHSFITNALLDGAPEAVVRLGAGHLDKGMLQHYTHVPTSESQSAMKRLADLAVENGERKEGPSN